MPRRRWSLLAWSVAKIGALGLLAALAGIPAAAPSAPALADASGAAAVPSSTSGAPPPIPPAACPLASEPARGRDLRELERALGLWGDWLEIRPGQRAWRPRELDPGWLPYFRGCWRWDGRSWSWVTDEPWGDVTYHFGRWTLHATYGWLWIPGRTWGPAWVAWRRDGALVGWAPLPPAGATPSMASWTFVSVDDFQGKWAETVALPRARVPALLVQMRRRGGGGDRPPRTRPAAGARVAAR